MEVDHEEHLQTLESIGSVELEAIRQKLLSRTLQAAIWTMINNATSYIPSLNKLAFETIQKSLESVSEKLQFVQCLYTRFLLLPKLSDITRVNKKSVIPEWANEKHHRTLYFVSQSKTRILIAEPPHYISVLDLIAIVVSHVLESPTPLPVGSLFICPENSEAALVDVLKLCSERRETELVGRNGGVIGQELLPQDAFQVQFHPLRPYYTGEIVAWQAQSGEKLKYGRVPEDVRPSAGQGLYRFNVEIAPGVIKPLLSSQVYSFKSISMGGEASSSHTTTENRMHVQASRDSTESREKSSQLQLSEDLQYGRVSAAEMVQTVHEMLSAAGINMGVEKQSLLEKTLNLQEQLKESQATLLLEQEKADLAAKEADTAKAAWLCRVCLSSEVDITIIPCGHVLCNRCSSAVSKCPFCRLQVSKRMKIYRP